jgi:hypothetical protein
MQIFVPLFLLFLAFSHKKRKKLQRTNTGEEMQM